LLIIELFCSYCLTNKIKVICFILKVHRKGGEMEIFLQMWGGFFYLLAKIFLAHAEKAEDSEWRMWGWIAYLLGVPPWVIILARNHNWIALMVEAGGVPAILLGILVAVKQLERAPTKIVVGINIFVCGLVVVGIMRSMYDFGGITSLSQILECGVMVGFLFGTFLLAQRDRHGWLCFMLMNVSMGSLMAMQAKWIFATLQLVSLYFVSYGFIKAKK
jgi:hypothetical protein